MIPSNIKELMEFKATVLMIIFKRIHILFVFSPGHCECCHSCRLLVILALKGCMHG